MKYTAKGINASNMLVKLKAIQIQSHYEKVKIKKIKYVYILMNRMYAATLNYKCSFFSVSTYNILRRLLLWHWPSTTTTLT